MKSSWRRSRKEIGGVLRAALAVLLAGPTPGWAGVPAAFNYQGVLREAGIPVNGLRELSFRVTDTGGAVEFWRSGAMQVVVSTGLFRVALEPPTSIQWGAIQPFLEVRVGTTTLLPRERLGSVAYAFHAFSAETVAQSSIDDAHIAAGAAISPDKVAGVAMTLSGAQSATGRKTFEVGAGFPGDGTWDATGKVGIGNASPAYKLDVAGQVNATGGLCIDGDCKSAWPSATDGIVGNEVAGASDNSLALSGAGTALDPLKLKLNLGSANIWTAAQTFSLATNFPNGTWSAFGDVGIGTNAPGFKLDVAGQVNAAGGLCIDGDCKSAWPSASSEVVGNEVLGAADGSLARTGSGTAANPYKLKLNPANANAWSAAQAFNGGTTFPGSGTWDATGKVGIGNASPGYKLDVSGQVNATGGLCIAGDCKTVWPSGAGETIGNEVVDAADGSLSRMGSGTTADPYKLKLNLGSANTWGAAQTFNGGTTFPGSGTWDASGGVGVGTADLQGYKVNVAGALNASEIRVNGTLLTPGTGSNWTVNGADVYRAAGSVGIGNTSPAHKLDVTGEVNATGGLCIAGDCKTVWPSGAGETIGNEVTGASDNSLMLSGAGTTLDPLELKLNLANVNTWTAAQTFNAATTFGAAANLPDGIWNVSGDVGIGTNAPAYKLEVVGSVNTSDKLCIKGDCKTEWPGGKVESSSDGTVTVSGTGTTADPYKPKLNLANANTWTAGQTFSAFQTFTKGVGFAGNGLWSEAGRIGIGTITPLDKLHISGGGIYFDDAQDALLKQGGRTIMWTDAAGTLKLGPQKAGTALSLEYGVSGGSGEFQIRDASLGLVSNATIINHSGGTGAINVRRSLKIIGAGNGIIFQDGTTQTTAAAADDQPDDDSEVPDAISINNTALYARNGGSQVGINGTYIGANVPLTITANSASAMAITVRNDLSSLSLSVSSILSLGSHLYTFSASPLHLGTNFVKRLSITSDGNVGIGTTAPTAALEVAGQVKITGGSPGANKVLVSDSGGTATWKNAFETAIKTLTKTATATHKSQGYQNVGTTNNTVTCDTGYVRVGCNVTCRGNWSDSTGSDLKPVSSEGCAAGSNDKCQGTEPNINIYAICLKVGS